MLNRLRSLFEKEVRKPDEIPFEDLPAYIEKREEAVRIGLENEINARRPQIVAALENIKEILASFTEIERKTSSHPKLEKIAQSSLPHFVRSLQQHINRPLPDAGEEFYHEVGILLKGSISGMKGAGKYLPMVFPEEMKALRNEIGIIGRTINELTSLFSKAEEDRQQLSSLLRTWNTFRSLMAEKKGREVRIKGLRDQVAQLQNDKERVRQSLDGLKKSSEYLDLEDKQSFLNHLNEDKKNLHLKKGQSLGAVLSVYRRAARIARHQNNREREKILEEAINRLESSSLDCELIRRSIQGTVLSLMELIHTGALPLKGQDEQRIFSSPEIVTEEVYRACEEIRSADQAIEELQEKIRQMPVHATLVHLIAEEGGLIHMSEKILQELTKEENDLKSLPQRIDNLEEELRVQVPIVLGKECSIIYSRLSAPRE